MTTATVELKASLSEYLRRVKAGEEVLVSERGRSIAKLVPVTGADALPDHLADMAGAGAGAGRVPTAVPHVLESAAAPGSGSLGAESPPRGTRYAGEVRPLTARLHVRRSPTMNFDFFRIRRRCATRRGSTWASTCRPPRSGAFSTPTAVRRGALARHGRARVDGDRDPGGLRGRGVRLPRTLRARRGARAQRCADPVRLDRLPRRPRRSCSPSAAPNRKRR